MKCKNCYSELQRPGDYCLKCGRPNTDVVGIYLDDPVHVFCFFEGEYVGGETVRPIKSVGEGRKAQLAEKNTLELVSEVIHRKRPERTIAQGVDPEALYRLWDAEIEYTEGLNSPAEFQNSVEEYLSSQGELERVDMRPWEKIGGKHQTIIELATDGHTSYPQATEWLGITHHRVNRSETGFVDKHGFHANGVENLWSQDRDWIEAARGYNSMKTLKRAVKAHQAYKNQVKNSPAPVWAFLKIAISDPNRGYFLLSFITRFHWECL